MTERVWSRQDIEDRVNVLRERHDGEAFAGAIAEFSEELGPEEQEDLREILLERSREHAARNAALDERLDQGGWLRRTFGKIEDAERRQRERSTAAGVDDGSPLAQGRRGVHDPRRLDDPGPARLRARRSGESEPGRGEPRSRRVDAAPLPR